MDYFPAFLDIRDADCLIIGGGVVALRKIELLSRCGARITVLAKELHPDVAERVELGELRRLEADYEPGLLDGRSLVVAATDDQGLNRRVAADCKARQLPVNVVDDPQACSFITPSIVDRSPVMIAVSSGGSAPVLARNLRTQLEADIPVAYGRLAELAAEYRPRVKTAIPDMSQRRHFWEAIFDGPVAEYMFAGRQDLAKQALDDALSAIESGDDQLPRGEVYLVGGGPGDPDLLTFRALRLMQKADVVLYDRLVSSAVMDLVRRDADRIDVGKRRSDHTLPQEDINQLLVRLAREGKRVLRLKGGDPFIFGRGGEEIDTLAAEGIPFQVVPGITAASGCAAYAGIPLTHRDFAHSCIFVTGHQKNGELKLNWPELVAPNQTIVFYMGRLSLPIITEQLQKHGLPASHPIALVEEGTLPSQAVVTGTLGDITDKIDPEAAPRATLLIVGEVVKLRDKLNWFRGDV
ncbi:MAG: siroheme synthase CysG [Salinisphaeraceae bacterium]|nr:siroheme synthase CysG [Salinisphaeraceae bacterium]